jgi:hypothetical protein
MRAVSLSARLACYCAAVERETSNLPAFTQTQPRQSRQSKWRSAVRVASSIPPRLTELHATCTRGNSATRYHAGQGRRAFHGRKYLTSRLPSTASMYYGCLVPGQHEEPPFLILASLGGSIIVAKLPSTLIRLFYSQAVRGRQAVWNVELGSIRSVFGSRPSDLRVVFVEHYLTFSLAFGMHENNSCNCFSVVWRQTLYLSEAPSKTASLHSPHSTGGGFLPRNVDFLFLFAFQSTSEPRLRSQPTFHRTAIEKAFIEGFRFQRRRVNQHGWSVPPVDT